MSNLFDALGSRLGTLLAALAIGVMCFGTVVFLRSATDDIRQTDAMAEIRQLRNAFVALNELMRLNMVVTEIETSDDFGPENRLRLSQALDIIFVRADFLSRNKQGMSSFAMTRDVTDALNHIVSVGDNALRATDVVPDAIVADLRDAVDAARQEIFIQPAKMEELQVSTMNRQAEVVAGVTRVTVIAILVFGFFGLGWLLLLRREVVSRKKRAEAERRAQFLAYFDPLTELPNRVQFQDDVTKKLAQQVRGALVFVDLDEFKAINDTFGHAKGDEVLKHVAVLLQAQTDALDGIAARLSGDEFAAFLPVEDTETLIKFGESLIRAVSDPIGDGADSVTPGVSLGIAKCSQVRTGGTGYSDLLRFADFALYVSKDGGRRRVTIYDSELEQKFLERRDILDALPVAVAEGALDVFLQPKVRLADRRVVGFEALVRWQRNGAYVPPFQLVQLAEEAGLIAAVDHYVFDKAVKTVSAWNVENDTDFGVSINFSALEFKTNDVVNEVQAVLDRYDFPARLLTIEITESEELSNWGLVRSILSGLVDLGCRISIDDFGTGYSSLAYLRMMPADELKIDKSLVDEIEIDAQARFLFDTIVDLAHGMDKTVVVEGIERPAQARIIAQKGCTVGQGYLFGRPAPAMEALRATTKSTANVVSIG